MPSDFVLLEEIPSLYVSIRWIGERNIIKKSCSQAHRVGIADGGETSDGRDADIVVQLDRRLVAVMKCWTWVELVKVIRRLNCGDRAKQVMIQKVRGRAKHPW